MPRRPPVRAKAVTGPRRYLRYPEQFGMVKDPQMAPGTQAHVAAAVLDQHRLARRVHADMTANETDWETLAAALGVSEEQVRRLLRGESQMSLERMHALAAAIGYRVVSKHVPMGTITRELGDES